MLGKDLVKLKGLQCGVVDVLWRCLKKREVAGDLLMIPVDEFRASRTCNKHRTNFFNTVKRVKDQSVLGCKSCNTL